MPSLKETAEEILLTEGVLKHGKYATDKYKAWGRAYRDRKRERLKDEAKAVSSYRKSKLVPDKEKEDESGAPTCTATHNLGGGKSVACDRKHTKGMHKAEDEKKIYQWEEKNPFQSMENAIADILTENEYFFITDKEELHEDVSDAGEAAVVTATPTIPVGDKVVEANTVVEVAADAVPGSKEDHDIGMLGIKKYLEQRNHRLQTLATRREIGGE